MLLIGEWVGAILYANTPLPSSPLEHQPVWLLGAQSDHSSHLLLSSQNGKRKKSINHILSVILSLWIPQTPLALIISGSGSVQISQAIFCTQLLP